MSLCKDILAAFDVVGSIETISDSIDWREG